MCANENINIQGGRKLHGLSEYVVGLRKI